jgi:hypothetical protein
MKTRPFEGGKWIRTASGKRWRCAACTARVRANNMRKKMNLELIKEALQAADSLLGVVIHSGAYLQTAEGREDAQKVRDLVKEALAHAQTQ